MQIEPHADLYIDDCGVFRWDFRPRADIGIENAKKGYQVVDEILEGIKLPVLVDMRGARKIDKPSRDFYKNNSTKFFIAGAMIIDSPISKIIANFFIGLNRPPMPMRIVNSEKEGIEWLRTFIPENFKQKGTNLH